VSVSLIGAGPGDPGLFTMRGAELLGRAEVVIYDRLIGHELLDLAPPGAELINVGKSPGTSRPQAEINAQLVEHGRAGRRVVRLKGGDPFVFGRGGEEAEALRNAGVDYEVVPGVSSAFAAPAAAGIPVTHRGMATSVTVVTGHVGDQSAPGGVDWYSLGRAGGTLVILMGMSERARIASELIGSGRDAGTPVAVVHWGTTPHQQVVRSTLGGLASVELPAPSAIVVGPVAALDLGPAPASGGAGSS
jgi:uroporphyrin-III C-methyltransferase